MTITSWLLIFFFSFFFFINWNSWLENRIILYCNFPYIFNRIHVKLAWASAITSAVAVYSWAHYNKWLFRNYYYNYLFELCSVLCLFWLHRITHETWNYLTFLPKLIIISSSSSRRFSYLFFILFLFWIRYFIVLFIWNSVWSRWK